MHQRIIHTHVKVSSKAYVYDDTIYNFCARARFAGCSYLRRIILGLNTVQYMHLHICRTILCKLAFEKHIFLHCLLHVVHTVFLVHPSCVSVWGGGGGWIHPWVYITHIHGHSFSPTPTPPPTGYHSYNNL
jgi:hypothetical protein